MVFLSLRFQPMILISLKIFLIFHFTSKFASGEIYGCYCTSFDVNDVTTLLEVRDALDSSKIYLTDWNSDSTCGNGWSGVSCDFSGKISSIVLASKNLPGYISSSIGNLSGLKILNITNTFISGIIPLTVGNLFNLVILDLHGNYLTGSIPSNIGNIISLEYLDLGSNSLTGSIPNVGSLINLNHLDLGRNDLWGIIPESVGLSANLNFIDLSYNYLTGRIPSNIGDLSKLSSLSLNNNFLSGEIPSSVEANCSDYSTFNISQNCLAVISSSPCIVNETPGRNESLCSSVCNPTQSGGPCGGNGTCYPEDSSSFSCSCYTGYSSTNSTPYTCTPDPPSYPPPAVEASPPPLLARPPSSPPVPIQNLPPSLPVANPPHFAQPPRLPPLQSPPLTAPAEKICNCVNFTQDDVSTLVELQSSLDPSGLFLTNWSPSLTCLNGWTGVACDENGHVTSIFVDSKPLQGTLPSSISKLTNLQNLSLYNASLTGTIPEDIVNMTSLESLELSNNYFIGSIPQSLESKCSGSPSGYLSTNCLTFNISQTCTSTNPQRSVEECAPFCNALQPGGVCSGHGNCVIQNYPFIVKCRCYTGYKSIATDPFTCVGDVSPPPTGSNNSPSSTLASSSTKFSTLISFLTSLGIGSILAMVNTCGVA